jgi:hypothetical protein
MKTIALISAFAATLTIFAANADDAHHPEKSQQPAATSLDQPGTPMMGMMQTMGGSPMAHCDRIDGWLAFLNTELKITNRQSRIWETFAGKLRKLANKGESMPMAMMGTTGRAKEPWPDRIAAMSRHAESHAAKLEALADAARPLYAALSDEQKRTADEILPLMLCASGAMGMRMGVMSGGKPR